MSSHGAAFQAAQGRVLQTPHQFDGSLESVHFESVVLQVLLTHLLDLEGGFEEARASGAVRLHARHVILYLVVLVYAQEITASGSGRGDGGHCLVGQILARRWNNIGGWGGAGLLAGLGRLRLLLGLPVDEAFPGWGEENALDLEVRHAQISALRGLALVLDNLYARHMQRGLLGERSVLGACKADQAVKILIVVGVAGREV